MPKHKTIEQVSETVNQSTVSEMSQCGEQSTAVDFFKIAVNDVRQTNLETCAIRPICCPIERHRAVLTTKSLRTRFKKRVLTAFQAGPEGFNQDDC